MLEKIVDDIILRSLKCFFLKAYWTGVRPRLSLGFFVDFSPLPIQKILEIGSFEGQSACYFSKKLTKGAGQSNIFSQFADHKVKNNLYISYDNVVNKKYKIEINQKTLERVKNNFN